MRQNIRQEWLSLLSLDTAQNRWRTYTIKVTFLEQPSSFCVQTAWGRMNRYQQSKTDVFDDRPTMLKFLETTLKRRKRHGYQIVEKSQEFPTTPTLSDMPKAKEIQGQLRLF